MVTKAEIYRAWEYLSKGSKTSNKALDFIMESALQNLDKLQKKVHIKQFGRIKNG